MKVPRTTKNRRHDFYRGNSFTCLNIHQTNPLLSHMVSTCKICLQSAHEKIPCKNYQRTSIDLMNLNYNSVTERQLEKSPTVQKLSKILLNNQVKQIIMSEIRKYFYQKNNENMTYLNL